MDKIQREFIEKIKNAEPFRGTRIRVSETEEYKIETLGRGEMGFYQQNERALLFEQNAGYGIILKKSIREWDTGEKVTPTERELILQRISDYMRSTGIENVIIK